ncbi:unnamed protein product [Absidia cylindrospora]
MKEYAGYLTDNYRFSRENFADNGNLCGSALFFQCIIKCVVKRQMLLKLGDMEVTMIRPLNSRTTQNRSIGSYTRN